MQMRKKLLSMLVLLTAAAPGAWADDEVTLTPQGENGWTLVMPASDVELEVTYYTEEELYEEGVELTKNADGTWSLATMPGFDVELQIEYKADLTLTVSIEDWTYGAAASAPAVNGNEGNGNVTYEYKKKDAADDTYTADVPTAAGDYTVRATVAETDDYADATATADFTIQQATGIDAAGTADAQTDGEWYDLNGRRVAGKPAVKGVFIQNGKKVVVK